MQPVNAKGTHTIRNVSMNERHDWWYYALIRGELYYLLLLAIPLIMFPAQDPPNTTHTHDHKARFRREFYSFISLPYTRLRSCHQTSQQESLSILVDLEEYSILTSWCKHTYECCQLLYKPNIIPINLNRKKLKFNLKQGNDIFFPFWGVGHAM